MKNLFALANARTWETGREHVVCIRAGYLTVQSKRVATFANYTII